MSSNYQNSDGGRPWTAGPWVPDDDGQFGEIAIETPGYELVALIYAEGDERPTAAANARLISAAPELFEAVYSARQLLSAFTGPDDDIATAVLALCDQALAKALPPQPVKGAP